MTVQLEYGVPTDRSGINVRFGIAKGFFRDEGIDLSVRVVFGGPEIAAAYDSGVLRIGELGTPPGITAIASGHRFRIIGSGLQRGPSLFFLVRPDIAAWTDLKGTVVGALSKGSCSYWYLRELLQQHGVDPDRDVVVRGLGDDYPRQLELFRQGEIAALLSAEPNGALGEALGVVKSWGDVLSLGDVPKLQWVIQVANDEFLRREPELVRAALRAARRASRHLVAHPDEWVDFAASLFDISKEVAAEAVRRELPLVHADGELDLPGLRHAISLQHQLGAIDHPLPVERFIASGFGPAGAGIAA